MRIEDRRQNLDDGLLDQPFNHVWYTEQTLSAPFDASPAAVSPQEACSTVEWATYRFTGVKGWSGAFGPRKCRRVIEQYRAL
jgi:hypothetical protein